MRFPDFSAAGGLRTAATWSKTRSSGTAGRDHENKSRGISGKSRSRRDLARKMSPFLPIIIVRYLETGRGRTFKRVHLV